MFRGTCLVIPVYRCEPQVVRVITALSTNERLKNRIESVRIYDNQSPDATFEVACSQVKVKQLESWIEVVQNDTNAGLGGTQKYAFQWAIENQFSNIVVFHGDDQADVADIHLILDRLDEGWPAVLGSRFMKSSRRTGYSPMRNLGNRFLNVVFSILLGRKIYDLGSGLNGFKVAELKDLKLQRLSNGFNFNVDLLLELVSSRKNFVFVPISWREEDQVSNAKNLRVAVAMLASWLRWRFRFGD